MALTPNYSWPTPDNTDLVKDGAEAIRDLGNAIDNTVNNLPSGALVHIVTTSFSASSSESFNDVFSATYDSYKIIIKATASSGAVAIRYRMRVAGADNSTSNYDTQLINGSGTTGSTVPIVQTLNENSGRISTIINTGPGIAEVLCSNPFIADRTVFVGSVYDPRVVYQGQGSEHKVSTSFTGLTLFPASGTMTGSVSIYGLAKA